MSLVQFIDLGRQPISNGFLAAKKFSCEKFYNLRAGFDRDTYLVSLMPPFPDKTELFHGDYVYRSGMSKTMVSHFKKSANSIKDVVRSGKILEIGSNDGTFLKNFDPTVIMSVEPCMNFAKETRKKGYHTINDFWNEAAASAVLNFRGKMDAVFAANCICHIPDVVDTFRNVAEVLEDDGVFVFEDPSLYDMLIRNTYDQIYEEHAHIFSVLALDVLLREAGMRVVDVEYLPHIHGGSNRIWAAKEKSSEWTPTLSVEEEKAKEKELCLDEIWAYKDFAGRVEESKLRLRNTLITYKNAHKRIISYGATSKSSVVFNYCGIGPVSYTHLTLPTICSV